MHPADEKEIIEAWMTLLSFKSDRTALDLNGHDVPLLFGTDRNKLHEDAYTIPEETDAEVTIISTGEESCNAFEGAEIVNSRGPCNAHGVSVLNTTFRGPDARTP